ncbi:hypothetical protein AOLI_G00135040, partial [Acnodon oligacanthus]
MLWSLKDGGGKDVQLLCLRAQRLPLTTSFTSICEGRFPKSDISLKPLKTQARQLETHLAPSGPHVTFAIMASCILLWSFVHPRFYNQATATLLKSLPFWEKLHHRAVFRHISFCSKKTHARNVRHAHDVITSRSQNIAVIAIWIFFFNHLERYTGIIAKEMIWYTP